MTNPLPIASIGLISDTHFLERLFHLPDSLASIWSGIHLILHAGDVGDPRVLDELARLAPVVAVRGNDDPDETKHLLPEKQVIPLRGHRILLWHSHYPDPAEEKARRADAWGFKLERIARHGQDAQADIVVYGHTHVPMASRLGNILLFNPGALASGSYFTRQKIQSVGRLQLMEDGRYAISHFDVGTGQPREFPSAEPAEAFPRLGNAHQEWLVEPGLIPFVDRLRNMGYRDFRSVIRAVIPEYRRIFGKGWLRRKDLIAAFRAADGIDPDDRQKVLAVLAGDSGSSDPAPAIAV
ncbi:MAG: metallophosphoesterase family protein [Anaerolineales bacterium]|nr:metallophosphoesterase family protein [Anaerolineales bacterium]